MGFYNNSAMVHARRVTGTAAEVAVDFDSLGLGVLPRAEATTSAATKSALVDTENIPETADGPVFRPVKVMVNAVTAGMSATAVVMVMLLSAITDVAVRVGTEEDPAALTAGVADLSNQPVGKPSVILPPTAMRAAEVVNLTTTVTAAAARAVEEGETDSAVTLEPIPPEGTPAEAMVFDVSVCTVMPVALPAFAGPNVTPLRVMVKAVFAGMPAIKVLMTMEVAVGAAEVAVIVGTDVVPAALAAGVADVAKNPLG